VWTFAGYAVVLRRLAGHRLGEPDRTSMALSGRVSMVMAARNEAARIEAKVAQLLALPREQLHEIIVACDHCSDDTAAAARRCGDDRVKVVEHDEGPSGKAGALNAGVAAATGELVLFGDVRQRLDEAAIPRLAARFDDPATGAVSGALQIERSDAGVGKGIDAYWSLEKRIRHWESQLDSSIGCTGAIYMIRRELYVPMPADTILDDVVLPMLIAQQGRRVLFEPTAEAFDPQPLSGPSELRRKTRTLAGNFQMLARYPAWLFPWSCRLWWKVISHKYLRIATPFILLLCLIACVMLRHHELYALLLAGALALIALALLGLTPVGRRTRLMTVPASFLLMQISIVRGFIQWVQISLHGYQGWK
jgi:cellulose synthase/poly-beta-1,6-N-acetylglucosamine synthase-like glycosyltransferase